MTTLVYGFEDEGPETPTQWHWAYAGLMNWLHIYSGTENSLATSACFYVDY